MAFVIGLLTFFLVVVCLLLALLVLIQLPKKEAGVGVAFGGAATDALFGAGSGNVLTKATKYAAGAFFGLSLVLSVLQTHVHNQRGSELRKEIEQQAQQPAPPPPPATAPAPKTPAAVPANTSTGMNLLLPQLQGTNAAAPQTAPAAPAPTNGMKLLAPKPSPTNTPPATAPK